MCKKKTEDWISIPSNSACFAWLAALAQAFDKWLKGYRCSREHLIYSPGVMPTIFLNSRQALINYQERPEFNDTVTRAKSRIEEYAESRLFDRDGANGAKFSLANNFKAWKEKTEVDHSGAVNITIEGQVKDWAK